MTYDLSGLSSPRAALLVMHYQAEVFEILFGTASHPLVDRCNGLIEQWRATGRPVVFANFCLGANYEQVTASNRLVSSFVPTGWFRHARPVDGLDVRPEDKLYSCPRASVFHGTSLHDDLREQNIRSLLLVGIASSGVMLSSVAWASDADYDLHIVKDCCFDPDDAAHEALFRTGFATRARII